MVDTEHIRAVVVKGVKNYIGFPFIRSSQNANAPKYPYLAYTITTLASANNGTYEEYEDGTHRKLVRQIWSITSYSDDYVEAYSLASRARDWLNCLGGVYLDDNGVVVQSVGDITDRTNVLTAEYQYSCGFDCFFYTYDTIKTTVEEIETFDLSINAHSQVRTKIISDALKLWANGEADLTAQIADDTFVLSASEANKLRLHAAVSGDRLIVSQRW